MQAKSLKKGYVSLVEQACAGVPGFRDSYQQFHQKAVIEQNSSRYFAFSVCENQALRDSLQSEQSKTA